MGHTANTRESISKERAHVHFELDTFVNDRFSEWFKKELPGERNDHGIWNGQNFERHRPAPEILLEQQRMGPAFSLVRFIRSETELLPGCLCGSTNFPWLKRYGPLVRRNPVAEKEGVAG